MRKREGIVPRGMRLPLILTLVCNFLVYNGSRLFTAGRVHYNLSVRPDAGIPFVPWTVAIYLGCYLFWIVNYVLGCRQETEEAFCFLGADLFAKLVCLVCFLAVPTTVLRPAVEGSTIWHRLMRLVYRLDAADNLFPSIHCLTSWLCFIAVRKNAAVPGWYKCFSLVFALMVCVSTLTTKQHVLIDVLSGTALAEAGYFFVKRSGFAKTYERIMSRAVRDERRNLMHETRNKYRNRRMMTGLDTKKIRIWTAAGIVLAAAIVIRLCVNQKFDSVEALQDYMKGFGVFAPLALTLFQIIQVVVPVLPGLFGCAAGALMFGWWGGFLCSYIGISAGSLIAYCLGRKYGTDIILTMFSRKQYEKWSRKIKKSRSYDVLLFVSTLLPLFPDDFLCYFSGLIEMKGRKFVWIILLGKPWCILAYCAAFGLIK